jgi:curved DNA-binding protein CbpA
MGSARDVEVEAVLRATSLYEVLGVDVAVGDPMLRKAYLKKSLLLHPDKCEHPRATEAFQHIAHAYDTLSDPVKRRLYDLSTNHGAKPEASGATYGDEDGGEPVTVAQAFNMFDSAMKQFAREQGIEEVTRHETVLDTVASGFRFLDSLLGGSAGGSSSGSAGGSSGSGGGASGSGAGSSSSQSAGVADGEPTSRLQSWAQTLTAAGTVLSTFQQIYRAQRERERTEEEAARAAQAAGAAAQGTQTRNTEEAWSRAQARSRQTREGDLHRGPSSSSSSSSTSPAWTYSPGPD